MKEFEIFSTTADVGIRAWGADCAGLYRHALLALDELLFGPGPRPASEETYPFSYEGDSCENVLVNLLGEVLFLTYTKRKAVVDIRMRRADGRSLEAELLLAPWPCPPLLEIKSVTYHNLIVRSEGARQRVDMVVDI